MMRKFTITLALFLGLASHRPAARADFSFSLPLNTSAAGKIDLGFFEAGTSLTLQIGGHGDLAGSRYQVNADGTLYAPASGPYSFANQGAVYTTVNGGDGVNHFVGGGANYDMSGSGYPFAGALTTDTTNPNIIRFGAVVGTFSATPGRADWFLIGTRATIVVPTGGAHLYLAVNDTSHGDNHGAYSGRVAINAVPEPGSVVMLGAGVGALLAFARRRDRSAVAS